MNLENIAALSRELGAIELQISTLAERRRDLLAHLRDEVGDVRGQIKVGGEPVLHVTYRRTFSEEQARKILATNRDLLEQITEPKISAAKAKRVLPPAVYELCQVEGDTPVITPKAGRS